MGKYPRRKQIRLGEKLLQIRVALGLSQNEMLRCLGLENELSRTNISNYELGQREPPLFVLLQYSHLAGVCMDLLIDDRLDLPRRLPGRALHRRG
jgi:transcriptional regulator with XRE-family HTH domain